MCSLGVHLNFASAEQHVRISQREGHIPFAILAFGDILDDALDLRRQGVSVNVGLPIVANPALDNLVLRIYIPALHRCWVFLFSRRASFVLGQIDRG